MVGSEAENNFVQPNVVGSQLLAIIVVKCIMVNRCVEDSQQGLIQGGWMGWLATHHE